MLQVSLGLSAFLLSACVSVPTEPATAPAQVVAPRLSVFEQKMSWILRLEDTRSLKDPSLDGADLHLADGSTARVTLHTIDGTIPQLRRALDRSLDAFFDLLPGADEEVAARECSAIGVGRERHGSDMRYAAVPGNPE